MPKGGVLTATPGGGGKADAAAKTFCRFCIGYFFCCRLAVRIMVDWFLLVCKASVFFTESCDVTL